jgi:hypothetical protein
MSRPGSGLDAMKASAEALYLDRFQAQLVYDEFAQTLESLCQEARR